jgi:hypothetical protein
VSRNVYATQGRLLIAALKRKPHTYLDMLRHGVSCSPWKRVTECLRDDESLVKAPDKQGRTTWRVIQATRWTA